MRVNIENCIRQAAKVIDRVGDGSGYAYMLRDELLNHLKELRDDQAHPDGAITMSDCRGRTNVIHERDRNREFAGPIPEPIEPPHQGEAT